MNLKPGEKPQPEETEEEKQQNKDKAIEDEMKNQGNYVIKANQKRIQVIRHKVGQLDSVKAIPFEELEKMRKETEAKLKYLEEQYWGKKEKQEISKFIRDKYKSASTNSDSARENQEADDTQADVQF